MPEGDISEAAVCFTDSGQAAGQEKRNKLIYANNYALELPVMFRTVRPLPVGAWGDLCHRQASDNPKQKRKGFVS